MDNNFENSIKELENIISKLEQDDVSLEESIALLKEEAEQGVTHVVATPHFYAYHDTPEKFLERREKARILLEEEMKKYPDLPKLSIGAEVYFFRGISDSEFLPELTIDNKRFKQFIPKEELLRLWRIWIDISHRSILIKFRKGLRNFRFLFKQTQASF